MKKTLFVVNFIFHQMTLLASQQRLRLNRGQNDPACSQFEPHKSVEMTYINLIGHLMGQINMAGNDPEYI